MPVKKEAREILNMVELSEFLRMSSKTIRKYIHKNKIPYFRTGNNYRFSMPAIQEWIWKGGIRGGK
jgi:excisionase family DNA binding protein